VSGVRTVAVAGPAGPAEHTAGEVNIAAAGPAEHIGSTAGLPELDLGWLLHSAACRTLVGRLDILVAIVQRILDEVAAAHNLVHTLAVRCWKDTSHHSSLQRMDSGQP
jgi:hypothetical protein